MRFVNMDDVEPGQLLGRTVYSGNGTVLLSAGVQLTVYMINTLKRIGVTMIYLKDPAFEDVEIEDVISEVTKKEVFRDMSESLEAVRSGKEWNTRKISNSADQLLSDVLNNKELLFQLTEIRTKDNAHYLHAVNVALLSSMIGYNLGLNYGQLKELTIGALLHDIGKSVDLPANIDQEGLGNSHHTWKGFEILKHKREFSLLIAHTALQHHERLNGSGLPRGLSSESIHLYARIVAVANQYDNLISGEGGLARKALLPHEACEELMASSESLLDRDVLIEFNRIVSVYPTGTSVRLSTKESGVVVQQHRGLPGRPVVRVIRSAAGEELEVKEVDLATETTVFIDAVLA